MNHRPNDERGIYRSEDPNSGAVMVPVPLESATPDAAISAPKTAVAGTFATPVPPNAIQTSVSKNGVAVAHTHSSATTDNKTYKITLHITSGASAGDEVQVLVIAVVPGHRHQGACDSSVI